jgi:hypothetical protein
LNDWISLSSLFQTSARVLVVWLAFYGTGKLLRNPLRVDHLFPLLTAELIGLLVFVFLTVPLSILGVLSRAVLPVFLLLMAIPGALFVYGELRNRLPGLKPGVLQILAGIFLLFVLFLNFSHASMPNLAFDDPLVTYAVQPDRWLGAGRMFWLEESIFSGFPLLYEMTAVWPASLSSDLLNQLSVLQVFQMSLLLVAVFRGLSILGVMKKLWLPVAAIVLLTTNLYLWSAIAKTDTLCILLCTLAMVSAVRQREKGFTGSPLSSWLYMGLALAVKQTSIVVLLPFLLYSAGAYRKYAPKWKALALVSLLLIPAAYGVRTMLKTGSPTYPVYTVPFMLRSGWEVSTTDERMEVQSRASSFYDDKSFSLAKHIGIYFAYMEGCILLLLAGTAFSTATRNWRSVVLVIPMLAYFIVSLKLFWPPWWGAKYTILVYPFSALLGVYLLQSFKGARTVTISVMVTAFVVPGFFAVAGDAMPFTYRMTVARSVLQGEWDASSGYTRLINTPTPEAAANLWATAALPPETVIFSINEEKRYFFHGTVISGERHPVGHLLYLENSLEEELAILDGLGVDYVGFYRSDPAILKQEEKLAILDHIGVGDILEPVIIVDGGYLLCRYNGL